MASDLEVLALIPVCVHRTTSLSLQEAGMQSWDHQTKNSILGRLFLSSTPFLIFLPSSTWPFKFHGRTIVSSEGTLSSNRLWDTKKPDTLNWQLKPSFLRHSSCLGKEAHMHQRAFSHSPMGPLILENFRQQNRSVPIQEIGSRA